MSKTQPDNGEMEGRIWLQRVREGYPVGERAWRRDSSIADACSGADQFGRPAAAAWPGARGSAHAAVGSPLESALQCKTVSLLLS